MSTKSGTESSDPAHSYRETSAIRLNPNGIFSETCRETSFSDFTVAGRGTDETSFSYSFGL
jgi:hypothetical protein